MPLSEPICFSVLHHSCIHQICKEFFFVVTRLDFGTAMIVPAFCSLHRINGVLEL
jgi:hypothetical protein